MQQKGSTYPVSDIVTPLLTPANGYIFFGCFNHTYCIIHDYLPLWVFQTISPIEPLDCALRSFVRDHTYNAYRYGRACGSGGTTVMRVVTRVMNFCSSKSSIFRCCINHDSSFIRLLHHLCSMKHDAASSLKQLPNWTIFDAF